MPATARHTGYTRYTPLDADTARRLWDDFRDDPGALTRNALMEAYLPAVRYNAQRIHTKLPDQVDLEDLVSSGTFGLMDAIEGFDASRKIKFETYAAPRIRGAILDELRGLDWVPRLVRSRSGQVDRLRRSHRKTHGQEPSDDQIQQGLGVDRHEYDKIRRDSQAVGVVSLNRRLSDDDEGRTACEADVFADGRQVNPLTALQKRDLKDVVTKGLTRSERLIVVLYYYEQMTMREIGKTLELSESRVSQMHSSILMRLRAQLQHQSRELEESAV
jgi:RNA polymerase sigma factor for flagellar operon FliA